MLATFSAQQGHRCEIQPSFLLRWCSFSFFCSILGAKLEPCWPPKSTQDAPKTPQDASRTATRCIKMSPRYPKTSQDAPSLPQDAPKIGYLMGPKFFRTKLWMIFGGILDAKFSAIQSTLPCSLTLSAHPKLVLSPERRQFCNFLNDKSRVKRGGGHAA